MNNEPRSSEPRSSESRPPRIRGVAAVVQKAAAALRRDMTPAETRLWEEIRGKKLEGLRFRAQHPVGQFILDFYCPACKLALEIDGSSHDTEAAQDAARTAHLVAYGYWVLRFTNAQVMTEMAEVLAQIKVLAQIRQAGEEGKGEWPPRPKFGEPE